MDGLGTRPAGESAGDGHSRPKLKKSWQNGPLKAGTVPRGSEGYGNGKYKGGSYARSAAGIPADEAGA
jgi:hypothetical protein